MRHYPSLNFSRLLLSLVSGDRCLKALGDNAVQWRHKSNVVIFWNFPRALSSAEVQAFVISIRCAKFTAGAKSNGSIRRRTSARCMSISLTSLSFSRTSMDFSTLAKFDSLKLTETHCKVCGYSLHLFFWSIISYFQRNEVKCFTLKAPPQDPWGYM